MKPSLKLLLASATLILGSSLALSSPADIWMDYCARCHGETGKGDTRIGKRLNAKDYSDPAVQEAMTDEEIIRVTADGAVDANGRELMPAYKDELTSEEIESLVAYIRAFKS
jgi:mono/diheme cytochrome c family protein